MAKSNAHLSQVMCLDILFKDMYEKTIFSRHIIKGQSGLLYGNLLKKFGKKDSLHMSVIIYLRFECDSLRAINILHS